MRICIPIEFKPQGGGFYFLSHFESFLNKMGWQVIRDVSAQFDVLFTNHWMVPDHVIQKALLYNPAARVVHRIDGAAQDYGRKADADDRQAVVNRLADLTIFQSEYCRYSTRQKFSVISHYGPVIYNPVDVELFSPIGEKIALPGKMRAAAVTWSTNPLKGSFRLYEVARKNPEIDFILCGSYPEAPSLPNLHKMGVLGRDELAAVLRSCHFLVTFSQNEACPNHVLEALASGLPVLHIDSGAMAEIIGDCGLAVTMKNFSSVAIQLSKQIPQLSVRARARAIQHFHPDVIFPQYLEAIEEIMEMPSSIPNWKRRIKSFLQGIY